MVRSQLHSQLMLQQATDLHDQAVESLRGCRTAEALKTFRRALDTLHEIEDTLAPTASNVPRVAGGNPPRIRARTQLPCLRECDGTADVTSSLPVYDQALHFFHQASTIISCQHLQFYSAIILFNMGLAFQMRTTLHALRYQTSPNDGPSDKEIQLNSKAATCYEQTLQYLDSMQDEPSGEADRNRMRLFAWSNQCQIQQYQYCKQAQPKPGQRDSDNQHLMVELPVGLEHIRKLASTTNHASHHSSSSGIRGELVGHRPLGPISFASRANSRPRHLTSVLKGAAAA